MTEEKTTAAKFEIKKVKIDDLHETKNNPRQITKKDFDKLKRSLEEFPEMLDAREIVVDENYRILGGHQRVKALKALGQKEIEVKMMIGWTEDQKERFVIQDNLQNGDWDMDTLANEWDQDKLEDWGLELPSEDKFIEPDDFTEKITTEASKFMMVGVTALGQTEDVVLVDTIPEDIVPVIQEKVQKAGGKAVIQKIMEALNDL